jgi:DNA repair exonuclease SbcCD nuclease subunit
MVVAVVIGDLHFKKDSSTLTDLVIHKITEQIDKVKPDLVVFLGDILDTHERIDMKTQNRAVKFIKAVAAKGITVVVLIGNHERPDGTSYLTEDSSFYALKGFPGIYIADRVLDLKWEVSGTKDKIRFIFVPYVQTGHFHEALDTLEVKVLDKDNPVAAIFAHQELRGAKVAAATLSKTGDEWPESNPPIFSGHIHTFQQPQNNIVYPGTPYQQSYNDDSDKGILICEFKTFRQGEKPIVNFLPLDIRKKKTFRIRPSEIDSFVAPPNVDVQIDIVGTPDEIKALSSKGIISQLSSRGIVNVSLSTETDFNARTLGSKSCRDILLEMLKSDSDALEVYGKIFTTHGSSTLSIAPTVNLSELVKSSQQVTASNITTNSSGLLSALLASSRTAGAPYGSPLNMTPGSSSFYAHPSPLQQTERSQPGAPQAQMHQNFTNGGQGQQTYLPAPAVPISLNQLLSGQSPTPLPSQPAPQASTPSPYPIPVQVQSQGALNEPSGGMGMMAGQWGGAQMPAGNLPMPTVTPSTPTALRIPVSSGPAAQSSPSTTPQTQNPNLLHFFSSTPAANPPAAAPQQNQGSPLLAFTHGASFVSNSNPGPRGVAPDPQLSTNDLIASLRNSVQQDRKPDILASMMQGPK